MHSEQSPITLTYVSERSPQRASRIAAKRAIPVALVLVWLWIGSYVYFRARHSMGGVYASAPITWKQINYDEHYPWAKPLFYLHQPLAWLDQWITGTEIRTRKNDFLGDRDNYGLEAFN